MTETKETLDVKCAKDMVFLPFKHAKTVRAPSAPGDGQQQDPAAGPLWWTCSPWQWSTLQSLSSKALLWVWYKTAGCFQVSFHYWFHICYHSSLCPVPVPAATDHRSLSTWASRGPELPPHQDYWPLPQTNKTDTWGGCAGVQREVFCSEPCAPWSPLQQMCLTEDLCWAPADGKKGSSDKPEGNPFLLAFLKKQ